MAWLKNKRILFLYLPFVLGTLASYSYYFYLRYFKITPEATPLSTEYHDPKHQLCLDACVNIATLHCKEWSDFRIDLCPTTCDVYLDEDTLSFSLESDSAFRCAVKASSAQELSNVCNISCSPMEDL